MAVLIAHASISENGTIYGNKGDSTGKEVCTRTWYRSSNQDWSFMAIHPDAAVREKHAQQAEAACANDAIGYGQGDRNTLNTEAKKVNYNLANISNRCNCDCSSLQNVLAVASGAVSANTYTGNGWTTRNMRKKLQEAGYKIITDQKYLRSEDYCVRGAIYVREGAHTVCGVSNGSKANETLKAAGISIPETEKKEEPAAPSVVYYPKYTGPAASLDAMLAAVGVPEQYRGNWRNRKPLAEYNGISKDYTGKAEENTLFKKMLKEGKVKKIETSVSAGTSAPSPEPTPTPAPTPQPEPTPVAPAKPSVLYRIQAGAYSQENNAHTRVNALKAAGFDAFVFAEAGMYKVQAGAYEDKNNATARVAALKAAGFDAFIRESAKDTVVTAIPQPVQKIDENDIVRVKEGAPNYTGVSLKSFVYKRDHVVKSISGDRAVITYGGVVVAAVHVSNLILVRKA